MSCGALGTQTNGVESGQKSFRGKGNDQPSNPSRGLNGCLFSCFFEARGRLFPSLPMGLLEWRVGDCDIFFFLPSQTSGQTRAKKRAEELERLVVRHLLEGYRACQVDSGSWRAKWKVGRDASV